MVLLRGSQGRLEPGQVTQRVPDAAISGQTSTSAVALGAPAKPQRGLRRQSLVLLEREVESLPAFVP